MKNSLTSYLTYSSPHKKNLTNEKKKKKNEKYELQQFMLIYIILI